MAFPRLFWCLSLMLVIGCDVVHPDVEDLGFRKDVVERLNEARAEGRLCGNTAFRGTDPVAWNAQLATAALNHSEDLAKNGLVGHIGSDGSGPDKRIRDAGYAYTRYGEIVAIGSASLGEVVKGWLESPGHCAVLMNPHFTEAGAAFAGDRIWTVDFGTR